MNSEPYYIEIYSDFLRQIAAQMDGGDWDFTYYLDDDWVESEYFDRKRGKTVIIERTRIEPALNRNAFCETCAFIESSYSIKLPEDYKIYGFWFVKCSCFWGGSETPDLQYFTFLGIHSQC